MPVIALLIGLFFMIVPIALAALGFLFLLGGGLLSISTRLRKIGLIVMLVPSLSLIGAAAGCFCLMNLVAHSEAADPNMLIAWIGGLLAGAALGFVSGCAAAILACRRYCPAQEVT